MREDPRLVAARYRQHRDDDAPEADAAEQPPAASPAQNAADRAAYVETAIAQAIRRGDFDGLPGAGRPLVGLGESHDPDWWIRRKIQSEQLTGLGPPALTLRVEYAQRAEAFDAISRAEEVREAAEDFNRRVIEARRQLLGGPPVVTPTLDVDAEVRAWGERRRAREAAASALDDTPPHTGPRNRWWSRRRPR